MGGRVLVGKDVVAAEDKGSKMLVLVEHALPNNDIKKASPS